MKLIISAVAAAFALAPLGAFAAGHAHFHYAGSLDSGQTLTVNDLNGSVVVRSGAKLDVSAELVAHRGNPHDVRILTETSSTGLSICVRYPDDHRAHCDDSGWDSHGDRNDTTVDFTITVPSGVNVVANSVNGDVTVATDARASVNSVNGNIAVDAPYIARASTVNGNADVRVRQPQAGDALKVSSVNGSIAIRLPAATGLRVSASVLNGTISAGDGLTVNRPQFGPGESVDGTLGDGRYALTLKTLNGNITLTRA